MLDNPEEIEEGVIPEEINELMKDFSEQTSQTSQVMMILSF